MAFESLSLLDFIPALSPEYKNPPWHLREWCALIERAATEPVRGLCACPIRHYKTTTTLHGIVWLLLRDPTRRIILLSHSHQRAQTLGKQLRQLAKAAGIGATKGWDTIDEWRNDAGGGVVVMSAEQSKLGYDCGALFFDDPLDEMGWDDALRREAVDHTITHYTARCMRAGEPGPVRGVASRGHPDDPIGRRLARRSVRWEYVHYGAIIDEGKETERAYAPAVWSLAALKEMRAEMKESDPNERLWFAQLMGDPQPEGANLFGVPSLYTQLPTWGYRVAHGGDFAYTQSATSDWFALVTGRIYGSKLYILDVRRERLDAVMLESSCKSLLSKYGQSPIWSYQSGPEIGLSKLLTQRGVPIGSMLARYNKLVRAQKTIRRWNDGDILVPADESLPWRAGFLHRVSLFRGHEKDQDDEVDALVSLGDAMMGGGHGSVGSIPGGGRSIYQGLLG